MHRPVLGGSRITSAAGIHPGGLAKALVSGIEAQFVKEFKTLQEVLMTDDGPQPELPGVTKADHSETEEQLVPAEDQPEISAGVKLAVKKLHDATGHRDNKRLARALVLAGAPAEVVVAAEAHKCDLCAEQRPPKSRRPASLPTPRDTGDQVHLDLVEVFDVHGRKYYVVHVVDWHWATRFQMARLLPNRSSEEVICFLREMWWPIFGPPRVLVADQARELMSHDCEGFCSENEVLLWHTAVQASWQNGACERGGGILKCLIATVVKKHSVGTFSEMATAVHEATNAYNHDVSEAGVSPAQAALGKQPRMVGDVWGGFHARLSEHGLIDAVPHLARRLALRETAKVAMTRRHFSRAIRHAEVAKFTFGVKDGMGLPCLWQKKAAPMLLRVSRVS